MSEKELYNRYFESVQICITADMQERDKVNMIHGLTMKFMQENQ